MNMFNFINEDINQDNWSVYRPKFGKDSQLEVIGWSGKTGKHKLYVLYCKNCAKDSELFQKGYFRSKKSNLIKGQIPCGCSNKPEWSKEQYIILSKRKARELGYILIEFIGNWKGIHTKMKMLCEEHGEWSSTDITHLLNKGSGCPKCATKTISEAKMKSDKYIIESFLKSKAFHPDTKFWRSERETLNGRKAYWKIYCPDCKQSGESLRGDLQQGKRPCACSPMRQKEAYINLVYDSGTIIAIKFGIANKSQQRLKIQQRKSIYILEQAALYIFPHTENCKKAERECLQELECGIVSKHAMEDGWTETTSLKNLEKIIEIYERNGGILLE